MPLSRVRSQLHAPRLAYSVAAAIVADLHSLSKRDGVSHICEIEPYQDADLLERARRVRHEILVAQPHRFSGAESSAEPLRSKLKPIQRTII